MSIYSIECNCGKHYIGSTTRKLKARGNEHRSEYRNPNRRSFNTEAYCHFRECALLPEKLKLIKLEDVIENVNLRDRESHWINLLGELNSYDSLPNYDKYLVRKERTAEKGKVIRHCDCGGTWSYTHKARHLKTKKHKSYMIGLNELEE